MVPEKIARPVWGGVKEIWGAKLNSINLS